MSIVDNNYTLIDKDNLPEPGDIICKEANLMYPDDIESLWMDFEETSHCEVLEKSIIDSKTGAPTFKTKLSRGDIFQRHRIIGSLFGEYYIIRDKSRRNKKLKSILDD